MLIARTPAFAIAALIRLSEASGPVPLHVLARELGCHRRMLEALAQELVTIGVIAGDRGPGGGYRLAWPLSRISVGDVVLAFEAVEERAIARRRDPLPQPPLWDNLQDDICEALADIPLSRYTAAAANARITLRKRAV